MAKEAARAEVSSTDVDLAAVAAGGAGGSHRFHACSRRPSCCCHASFLL